MRGLIVTSTLFSAALAMPGCAGDEPTDEEAAQFRDLDDDAPGPWADLPANGDLTLFFGGHADVAGCDIWDFMSNNVTDAQSVNGDIVLSTEGDNIVDANGTVQCYREGNEFFETVHRDDTNEVVFSVLGFFVFDGELELDGTWRQNVLELHRKLLFQFRGEDVFDRYAMHDNALVTADVNIQFASRMRKFVIASLIAGECGGPGLPDPPPELGGP